MRACVLACGVRGLGKAWGACGSESIREGTAVTDTRGASSTARCRRLLCPLHFRPEPAGRLLASSCLLTLACCLAASYEIGRAHV